MVCPSCGKYVAGARALCKYCGAVLPYGVTPLSETHQAAGGGAVPDASKEMRRHGRDATACLILGIFSFASLPVVFTLGSLQGRLPPGEYRVLDAVIFGVIFAVLASAIPLGVLALVFGRRANRAIRTIQGRKLGDDRAKRGMVLGAVGAGFWTVVIILPLIAPNMFFHLPTGSSPVGTLRTINTAAITYSSQYGHGFPLRLSFLAPPKLGWNGRYEDPNDQAAGLIDEILAAGKKSGYRFLYVAGPVDSRSQVQTYTVYADPVDPKAGLLYYFTDQTGVIRQESKREADASSPPVD
jgi:hypothetical protein